MVLAAPHRPMIIAIDGPAASGKGTLGRRLAAHFGLAHLDTGMLYRAVALRVLEAGADPADEVQAARAAKTVRPEDLGRPGLRDERVSAASSKVAVHPAVRQALLEFQRNFARQPPEGAKGAVLDGRDIGTVICPEPDVIKFYISAGLETRARRRLKELQEKGDPAIYPAVLQDMKERDARDANRGIAALRKAPDAFDLDTSNLDADQVFAAALRFIEQKNRATG
jgi:cytidylate kinase